MIQYHTYTFPSLYIKKNVSQSLSIFSFVRYFGTQVNFLLKSLSFKSLQIDFALWQMFYFFIFLFFNVITVRENGKRKSVTMSVRVIHLEFDYHRDARLSLSVSVVCSLEGVMCTLSFTCSTVVPGK